MKAGHTSLFLFQSRWRIVCHITILLILSGHTAAAPWEMVRMPGSKDNTAACTLHAPTQPVSDGYDGTQARLMIQPDAVLIVTQAPLDTSFADIGLQVDERPFVHIDEVVERKIGRFASPYARLVKQFKAGCHVRVQLRFWPTWLVTGTHSVTFSLIGLTKAYVDMQACQHKSTIDGGQKP